MLCPIRLMLCGQFQHLTVASDNALDVLWQKERPHRMGGAIPRSTIMCPELIRAPR